ncbi:hypothetical protein M758_UG341500 [Ceratodon purpureus]|nr:hypothetical protein M758_UG341500 [Ceratodon purpureus]
MRPPVIHTIALLSQFPVLYPPLSLILGILDFAGCPESVPSHCYTFDGPWYTLVGLVETVLVKSARYYSQKRVFCHFTKGWVDFVALNHLQMGDTLIFAEVGEASFEVRKI